jgi:hypothetical protein
MENPAADWAECLARLPAVPGDKLKLLTDSLTLFKANEATTVGGHLQYDGTCCSASCGSLGPAHDTQVGNTPIGMSPSAGQWVAAMLPTAKFLGVRCQKVSCHVHPMAVITHLRR